MITTVRAFNSFTTRVRSKTLSYCLRAPPLNKPVSFLGIVKPKLKLEIVSTVTWTRKYLTDATLPNNLQNKIKMSREEEFKRLPTDVRPVNYDLQLKPNLKNFTFEGEEAISVKVDLCNLLFYRT